MLHNSQTGSSSKKGWEQLYALSLTAGILTLNSELFTHPEALTSRVTLSSLQQLLFLNKKILLLL